jgi:O-glycosyl hydrolase
MKRISNLAWLLLAFIISTCSTPAPRTNEVAPTDLLTTTALPHPSRDPLYVATPSQPANLSSDLEPKQIQVNVNMSYQKIDGFGATHKSLVYQGSGSRLSPELRAQVIETIYQQVGLNLGNVEGALLESPGSYEQRSNDNGNPDEFNWTGFQTFWADTIQSDLLAFAEPYGFDGYYIDQKVNVRWASPWLEELRSTDYSRYLEEAAEQVAAGSIYWRDRYKIVPRYVMLLNEPLRGNKELQSDNTQEVVDLVKAVGARLEREGFRDVRFVLPNETTVGKSLEIAEAVLSDPVARKYVGVIGYHPYPYDSPYANIHKLLNTSGVGTPAPRAVSARDRLRQLSQQYELPIWMTEVSNGGVDPTSYDDFRGRAIHIHDELVYAGASAYFGMNNMWDATSQQEHFGNQNLFAKSSEGTIVLIDNNKQEVYITGMGYAIGHYARWVESGAVRVEALSEDPLLQLTAFKSLDSDQLILVLINNHRADQEIQVEVEGATLLGSLSGEQSTANQYWAPLEKFQISTPVGFEITLPLESVTTLILPLGHN